MAGIKFIEKPPKRVSRPAKLAMIAGIFVLLLIAGYFVITSTAFFRGVILPQVGKALGAEVTVTGAEISPFSHVRLRNLKVQPAGAETFLTVREFNVDYSLASILAGKVAVAQLVIDSPTVTVLVNADGTCNLDAITKAAGKHAKPSPPAAPRNQVAAKTLQIDIKKVSLQNATVRLVRKYGNGGQDLVEVTGLNFTVNDLKNGQSGKMEIAAALSVQKAAQSNAAAAALQANLKGGFELGLTPDLKPAKVTGTMEFTVSQATGSLADFDAFATTLNCELTPTELKELALRFTRAGAKLADIRVSGPFDTARSEGKLRLEITGIDKQALNLAGRSSGLDFGTTTFNCTNDLEFTKGGKTIVVAGNLDLSQLQINQQNRASPTLDLHGDYAVSVDQTASSVVLQTFNLRCAQDSRALLQVGLTRPMTIAWGSASNAVGDASLMLIVTNLNLADWKTFAGDAAPGGMANVTLKLDSQKAGKLLAFALDAHLDNLATGMGNATVNQGDVHAQVEGSLADMTQLALKNFQVDVARLGKSLLKVSGSGSLDCASQNADLQVAAQVELARLLSMPGASPTNCGLALKGHVSHQQKKITLNGEVDLSPTPRAKNTLQIDGSVDISQASALTGGFKLAADAMDMTGYYDLLSQSKPAATNNQPVAASTTPASSPDQEPQPVKLPLKHFTFDLKIGHLYLREVDISSWVTTAVIDGGHIVVKPCQLALNGAPIKATTDLDLGVPGYTYGVVFNADAIPLAPLVNSFAPDRKGQIAGTSSINVQLQGAGVTGLSLKKNLTGQFNFATTNMDLSVANVRSPVISTILNVVVSLPDLISNPAAALGGLFGSHKTGWADALTSSPIDSITMQASAADGQVKLQSAEVRSAAFQVAAKGQVVLAPVLTNSTIEIPVAVSLSRPLAGQIGLVDATTPPGAAFVPLPDFLKIEGTVGVPKANINKLALVELAAKTGGGIAGKIGGAGGQKANSLLNAVGGLFGGGKSTATNAAPAKTNSSSGSGLFNFFKKSK